MNLPWYPWYPGDYAADTRDLSCAEHGCYRLLLDHSWANGPLPDDLDRLSRISAGASPEVLRHVLARYWELEDSGWINRRLEKVRAEQQQQHNKQAIAAAWTNWRRWKNREARQFLIDSGIDPEMLSLSDNATESVSDSHPTTPASRNQNQNQNQKKKERGPQKRFVKPTAEQLADYAREIGYNLNVQTFFDYYESNGWKVGRNGMKDWKATVRQWKQREAKDNPPSAAKLRRL